MGLFDKFKNIFNSKKNDKEIIEQKEELEGYDKGLEKSRTYFVDKISLLNGRYKKVTDEYF